MKAVTYQGKKRVKVKDVADAKLEKKDDILVRVTSTAICGSDLHIYNGNIPGMYDNYVIGHEPMGIVEEAGPEVTKVKKGDRVIIPFTVACGQCYFCKHEMESQCDHANDAKDTGGYLGYSETYGGYAGGQAELLRVPYGNFGPFVVPEDAEMEDEKLLFLSDILPTAWWSVENAGVKPGDSVIVLGCGPVGLLTQKFAWMKGASRVIAVDNVPYRLKHAQRTNNVEAFNFDEVKDLVTHLKEITRGGADVVIDCVGLDAKKSVLEAVETALKLQGGSLNAVNIASKVVRKSGTIQLTGVYGLTYNMFPLGHLFERNITLRMGQAPVIHYMPLLYRMIKENKFDPAEIITHRVPLDHAAHAYQVFSEKEEDCIKVVLKP
ncbi:S-(hydroxymethyl)glutathione dehydrogenase/alcohol dehydrogenase [Paenibacillus forsythiae]|uniref:S-(Hydroxymethyl)glutathione dehydrogenase/alcohol dehydrogenase n=1 Tax=Paenibacillus forsythiae TaxID=365616 RepID=A0ABU3H8I9_9BACL|nr:zinc-dependent alcohol dehydrogenase [Paenibacillus forsythiae]MDT3426332.1 S-(hydroxymethyl)glutathione dehydrogenase/alcohol dehydrogenase [Paenibacillus forsythiae]